MNDTSLDEAKKIFLGNDCSNFTMARESSEQYNLYLRLNISKEQENEWRKEQLQHFFQIILNITSAGQIGILYSKMYALVSSIKSKESLILMQTTIEKIINQLDAIDKLMVAETVIGRKSSKYRSGLIYMSHDMNEVELSKIFANYALLLVQNPVEDNLLIKRAKVNENMCQLIIKELVLDV